LNIKVVLKNTSISSTNPTLPLKITNLRFIVSNYAPSVVVNIHMGPTANIKIWRSGAINLQFIRNTDYKTLVLLLAVVHNGDDSRNKSKK